MNSNVEMVEDVATYVDFNELFFTPRFAADCFGLTTRRLKDIEESNNIEIRRVPRGTVTSRVYTPSDLFDLAALRRELGHLKGLARQVVMSTYISKGGTNKTTTAVGQAITCSLAGLRVLLVDNDPQGDTSSMLGYDPDATPEDLQELGIPADRIVDGHLGHLISPMLRMRSFQPKTLDEVIKKPFGESGPHLIPADASLEDLGVALDAANNSDMWYAKWVEDGKAGKIPGCDLSQYDVIIFDNAPAGSRLTKNSVAASDLLMSPVRMDKFSFKAILRLHDWCAGFAREYGFAPELVAVPTMFAKGRPRMLNNLYRLNQLFPGRVTEEKIFHSADYVNSLDDGVPLMFWKGANRDTIENARAVHAEVLEKIRRVAAQPQE